MHIKDMLEEVAPGKTKEEHDFLLWNCSCYPFKGSEPEAVEHYRGQILEALEARPDDPAGWTWDQIGEALENMDGE